MAARRSRKITDLAEAIAPYAGMLRAVVSGAMSPSEFADKYMAMYKDDETPVSDDVFDEMDGMFAIADAYVEDPAERPLVYGSVGADELTGRARALLDRAGMTSDG